jgi:hypothetical protein
MPEIEPLDLSRLWKRNVFEGSARDLGITIGDVIEEGLGQSRLTDALDAIIVKSGEATLARRTAARTPIAEVKDGGGVKAISEEEQARIDLAKALAQVEAGLRQENELLRMGSKERAIQQGLLEIEKSLKTDLKGEQEASVLALLQENQALKAQADMLEEIRGPQVAYEQGLATLNALMDAEKLTLNEYLKKLQELRDALKGDEQQTSHLADFLTSAFDNASSALASFIETGKGGFRELADSILADIARIASQKAALAFLNFLGGNIPFLGSLMGMQQGGSFVVGGAGGPDSQLVMFRATPRERVDVQTQQQQQQQRPATTNGGEGLVLQIINVLDPSVVRDAMASSDGSRVILNVITSNPQTVRQAIS